MQFRLELNSRLKAWRSLLTVISGAPAVEIDGIE